MRKLKIAILWHLHQPYYKHTNSKGNDEFMLPWVRLHGVKDYCDLPLLLNDYPNVKQSFNIVPSLFMQVDDYINGTQDKVQILSKIKAKELTKEQKEEILNSFFVVNYERLIAPYMRYKELYDHSRDLDFAVKNWGSQDWLDLQVWYNLAWIGQRTRQHPFIQRLFRKMQGYLETEKNLLLEFHNFILKSIIPTMSALQRLGQIEMTCSPMYHPILPLLCDSSSALEARPNTELPNPLYKYPQDAEAQINNGINYYASIFGNSPKGMWPSEGSVSNESIALIAKSGVEWLATDEAVLAASLGEVYKPVYKYFPYEIETKNGILTMFFRDHTLSDKIGFIYSNWHSIDAVNDFKDTLLGIRNQIIDECGQEALDSAVVPIILDGENCWEFYYENGIYFLRDFFNMLGTTDELETALFSECLNLPIPSFLPTLASIRAGSWINGNFDIWIGDEDDIKGWDLISNVRKLVEENKNRLDTATLRKIMEHIYIAEGSDWWWWYGPEHNAPNKSDFDVLFRWRIKEIYKLLAIKPPQELDEIICSKACSSNMSTMHKFGE